MRPLFILTLLCACGGSSPKPAGPDLKSPPTAPDAPAQVIDVAEAPPLTAFTSTFTKSSNGSLYGLDAAGQLTVGGGNMTLDRTYSVDVGADRATITFAAAGDYRNHTTTTSPLAGNAYALSATGTAHADGTAMTAEETTALQEFFEIGGLAVPVRDALAGKRVEKGQPVTLTAQELFAFVVIGAPDDATATVTLEGVDADGLATLTFTGNGTLPQIQGTWAIKGSLTVEAATLNPHAVDFEVTVTGSNGRETGVNTIKSSQTFTY